jgi:hypothetical protein
MPLNSPIVAPLEHQSAWEAHRAAIVKDLAPVGAVERALAERIALLWWRLDRAAVVEHAELVRAQADVEWALARERQARFGALGVSLPAAPAEVRAAVPDYRAALALLEELPSLADAAPLPAEAGAHAAYLVADAAALPLDALLPDPEAGLPGENVTEYSGWTAGALRRLVDHAAAATPWALLEETPRAWPSDVMLARTTEHARAGLEAARREAQRVGREVAQRRRVALLPASDVLARLPDYETALTRQLADLHQLLVACQAQRQSRSERSPGAAAGAGPVAGPRSKAVSQRRAPK